MEQSVLELCWLLQEVLIEKHHDFKITDSARLYHISKENGLSGTVFEVIKNHGVSKEFYKRFQKDFFQYVATDENQMAVLEQLKGIFESHKINYVLLKGARLKQLYKKSYMRSMGDIDLLVNIEKIEQVSSLLKENGYSTFSTAFVHDVYNSSSGVHVEIHKRLSRLTKKEKYLTDSWSHVNHGSFEIEFEIIYLLSHLRKHIKDSGIGLRSIIDFGVLLNNYSGSIDKEKLYDGLNEMELFTLFQNIISFNEHYLDIDLSEYNFKHYEEDDSLFESFTEYVVVSGMHGVGVSFNRFTGIVATMGNAKFIRLHIMIRKIFLPYNVLRDVYPKVMKNILLYPLGILIRIYDLTIVRGRINKKKLAQASSASRSNVEYNAALFSKLGIK